MIYHVLKFQNFPSSRYCVQSVQKRVIYFGPPCIHTYIVGGVRWTEITRTYLNRFCSTWCHSTRNFPSSNRYPQIFDPTKIRWSFNRKSAVLAVLQHRTAYACFAPEVGWQKNAVSNVVNSKKDVDFVNRAIISSVPYATLSKAVCIVVACSEWTLRTFQWVIVVWCARLMCDAPGMYRTTRQRNGKSALRV